MGSPGFGNHDLLHLAKETRSTASSSAAEGYWVLPPSPICSASEVAVVVVDVEEDEKKEGEKEEKDEEEDEMLREENLATPT